VIVEPIFESAATFTPAQFRLWVEEREGRGDVNHYELLHGRIVMNPPAAWPHGRIGARLVTALSQFVRTRHLGEVADSSQGYELPNGDIVEPDVSFISKGRLDAATIRDGDFLSVVPDLIVEILSPSTASRDRGEKLGIYEKSGVLEYWQIDPRARRVRVLVASGGQCREDQALEGEGAAASRVLSGFTISLAEIFD